MFSVVLMGSIVILAVLFDTFTRKIPNKLIIVGIIAGLVTNTYYLGLTGLGNSLISLMAPIVILFLLYMLRMMGAGDIKLYAAIGACMGFLFVIKAIVFSVLSGGVMAILILITKRNAIERFKYLKNYMYNCLILKKLTEYQKFEKNNNGLFRFSYAIATGVVLTYLTKI